MKMFACIIGAALLYFTLISIRPVPSWQIGSVIIPILVLAVLFRVVIEMTGAEAKEWIIYLGFLYLFFYELGPFAIRLFKFLILISAGIRN